MQRSKYANHISSKKAASMIDDSNPLDYIGFLALMATMNPSFAPAALPVSTIATLRATPFPGPYPVKLNGSVTFMPPVNSSHALNFTTARISHQEKSIPAS
jgi:hypothetical protein